MRRLDQTTFVAVRQLTVGDVDEAAAAGIRLIVNNRPDGEEPGQPESAEIEAAARAAGLDYRHIPVAGSFPRDQVETMALARAARGASAEESVAAAAAAGYDLGPIRGCL